MAIVAEVRKTDPKGRPIHAILRHDEDADCYYVEVHCTGLHQIVKVTDEADLQRWLDQTFKDAS